jgi:hypothetical protein
MNNINYLDHILYKPDIYHRRFDKDLNQEESVAKRIAVAALPFIGMYGPFGIALSTLTNSVRAYSHITEAVHAEQKGEWASMAKHAGQTSLALLALAVTVHRFTPGLWITSSTDFLQGAAETFSAFWEGDFDRGTSELFQTIASSFYLSFMMTGALELMLAFALMQAFISLCQARSDFSKGRYIEGVAKLAMSAVRLNQANGYLVSIQLRNELQNQIKLTQLFQRVRRAKEATHLIYHPLSDLEKREVIYKDHKENEFNFGAHLHGMGKSLVKGENLTLRTKTIEGKETIELDFKVNHAFRKKIEESISYLKGLKPKDVNHVLKLSGSHAESIKFSEDDFLQSETFFWFSPGSAMKIEMKGLGTFMIGNNPESPNLYNRVVVRMDAEKNLFTLHEILSLLDLDNAIHLSTAEDIERLKMGHLFRTFFPREALSVERTEEFFKMPLDKLAEAMIERAPEMRQILDNYLPRMVAEPLIDGRMRYKIVGLADEIRQAGGLSLTSAITGARTDEELFSRTASILKMGMIAREVRDENGLDKHGIGIFDYYTGGADSVFTQMITQSHVDERGEFSDFYYQSKVRLLISVEALELGSYQYFYGNGGSRDISDLDYLERPSILEFLKEENLNWYHEVMLKERIAPSYITGLVVPDQKTKDDLLKYLKDCGLLDVKIFVGNNITQDLFPKK